MFTDKTIHLYITLEVFVIKGTHLFLTVTQSDFFLMLCEIFPACCILLSSWVPEDLKWNIVSMRETDLCSRT